MVAATHAAHTYRDFTAHLTWRQVVRSTLRNVAVATLGLSRDISKSRGWIGFPYYHHVFDDERRGFARQLDYFRRFGEFLSLDDAVRLITSKDRIDGRYFCITFDDGFRNVVTNALPLLVEKQAPAGVFLATQFIGNTTEAEEAVRYRFFDHGQTLMEFLSWDEVRTMVRAGIAIGSHTVSHARLSRVDDAAAETEMRDSKEVIERELGCPCDHFCAPFGRPVADFDPLRHPEIAARIGYRSFLTTARGVNRLTGSPAIIKRDHMLAGFSNLQIRYFFGRG